MEILHCGPYNERKITDSRDPEPDHSMYTGLHAEKVAGVLSSGTPHQDAHKKHQNDRNDRQQYIQIMCDFLCAFHQRKHKQDDRNHIAYDSDG